MVILIKIINRIVNTIFYPLKYVSPTLGLAIAALLTGIVMLFIFRATSNQQKIRWAKDKIKGYILEIRLYRDSPKVIVRALDRILGYNAMYMRYALVPLLLVMVPVVLILVNLNFHYGYNGLTPGQSAIVKVRLYSWLSDNKVSLEAPANIKVETEALRIPSMNEIDWRIKAYKNGDYILKIVLGYAVETKRLQVGCDPVLMAPVRTGHSAWNVLLNPAELPLPKHSPIKSIEVTYPKRINRLLGIRMHWLVIFFGLSLLFAFALKGPMKVEI